MFLDSQILANCAGFSFGPPVSEDAIRAFEGKCGAPLPEELAQFLREANGGGGWMDDAYIVVFDLEAIERFATDGVVRSALPGVVVFGSDGGPCYLGLCEQGVLLIADAMEMRYTALVARSLREFLLMKDMERRIELALGSEMGKWRESSSE